jgi:DUF4097 and DUF4098 domain-containing protein YvlB
MLPTRKWLKILAGVAVAGFFIFLIAALAGFLHHYRRGAFTFLVPETANEQNENPPQSGPPTIPAPPTTPAKPVFTQAASDHANAAPQPPPAAHFVRPPLPAVSPILLDSLRTAQTRLTNVEAQYRTGNTSSADLDAAKVVVKILQSVLATETNQAVDVVKSEIFNAQQQLELETNLMNLSRESSNGVIAAQAALLAAQHGLEEAEAQMWQANTQAWQTGQIKSFSTTANGTPSPSYQWYGGPSNSPSNLNSSTTINPYTTLTSKAVKVDDSTDLSQSFQAGPGGKLTLNVDRGSVQITATDENTVTVHLTRRVTGASDSEAAQILKDEQVVLSQEANEISITAENPPELQHMSLFSHPNLDAQYEITVPRRFEAQVETSGGEINVSGIQGSTGCKTSGGRIICNEITGDVNARTMGGDVQATGCKGRIDLATMGGSIIIDGFSGASVHATTSGGSVSANFDAAPTEDSELKTSGGNIAVQLPDNAALQLEGQTFAGSEKSDFPVEIQDQFGNGTLSGAINGGGPMLRMNTSAGNLEVRKK